MTFDNRARYRLLPEDSERRGSGILLELVLFVGALSDACLGAGPIIVT